MPKRSLVPDVVEQYVSHVITPESPLQQRLALYEELANQQPAPFQWKFDRAKLSAWLAKIEARQKALVQAQLTCLAEVA